MTNPMQRLGAAYKAARLTEETLRGYMRIAYGVNLEKLERQHRRAKRIADKLKHRLEIEKRG